MDKLISVILVTYNGYEDTLACIQSIFRSDPSINYNIVIIDNDSPNKSADYISAWLSKKNQPAHSTYNEYRVETYVIENRDITLIRSTNNGGFAFGNNLGISYSQEKFSPDFIWLLNNDTVIKSNAISELLKTYTNYFNQGNNVGIIGSKLLYFDHPELINSCGGKLSQPFKYNQIGRNESDKGQYDDCTFDFDYVEGAAMFIPIAFIKEVGLMNEELFLYQEEFDWTSRAKKNSNKWNFLFCPNSIVLHKVGASCVGDKKSRCKTSSFKSFYYSFRNALYTYLAYKPFPTIKVYYYALMYMSKTILSVVLHNDPDKSKRIFLVLKAFIDGLSNKMGKRV